MPGDNLITKDLGAVSAYAQAVEAGFTGTQEDWVLRISQSAKQEDMTAVETGLTDLTNTVNQKEATLNSALVHKPVAPLSPDGTDGQLLRTHGDGTTEWVDEGLPTDAQTATAVTAWLNAHPEATTTVQDGAITRAKLDADLQEKTDMVPDLKQALNDTEAYVGINVGDWKNGKAYDTPSSVTTMQTSGYIDVPTFSCTAISVVPGDVVTITGTGGSGSKLWVWTRADGTIITRAASNAVLENGVITAPDEAAWLLSSVKTANPHSLTKGTTVDARIAEIVFALNNAVETLETNIDHNLLKSQIRIVDNQGDIEKKDDTLYADLRSKLRQISNVFMNNTIFQTTTIFDYAEKASASATGNLYEGLRVRDIYGNQFAPIYVDFDPVVYKSANMAFGYKADGTPDQRYNAENIINGQMILGNDTFFLVLQDYTSLDVRFYSPIGTYKTDYHVGAGQEFTTFHSCLNALKGNTSPKTIHVYGGTYDILSELGGADFLARLSGNENWYDVCDIIPPNTHVIGHGNVIFDLTIPSGTATEKASLLSPINMIGSSTVENVTINCSGGRYCVHAEGSRIAANNNAVWRIINCKINKTNNLSGVANTIGAGLNDGNYLDIRGCIITNDGNAGLLVHDQQIADGGFAVSPRINVEDCAFDVSAYPIVMSSTHSGAVSGAVLELTAINCYCGNKFMRKIGSGNKDVFHATYINTPHRIQNGAGIVDIIPDTDYSNFSLTLT